MKEALSIKNKVSGCKTAPISHFSNFQGDLKKMDSVALQKLKTSIKTYGFTAPLFIWKKNILDGHQRKAALESLESDGYSVCEVPYVEIDAKDEVEAKKILLTYVSQYGEIEKNGLAEFIKNAGLNALELENFTTIDFGDAVSQQVEPDDYEVALSDKKPKAKNGEIYQLGGHKLMCGDSTSEADVAALMAEERAAMVFTDPPYNIDYTGGMNSKTENTRDGILNDKMSKSNFFQFLSDVCKNLNKYCDGAQYICMSSSELDTLKMAFEGQGGHWQSFIIWVKNVFTLSRSDYQHTYEPILYGWSGNVVNHHFIGNRDIPNVWEDIRELRSEFDGENTIIKFQGFEVKIKGKVEGEVRRRKQKTDIWRYDKPNRSKEHPTMKPIELCAEAIKNSSKQGEVVLDLFGGSGSTLIACEQLNRKARLMELDPKYVDVIIDRWEKLTGLKAEKLYGKN